MSDLTQRILAHLALHSDTRGVSCRGKCRQLLNDAVSARIDAEHSVAAVRQAARLRLLEAVAEASRETHRWLRVLASIANLEGQQEVEDMLGQALRDLDAGEVDGD